MPKRSRRYEELREKLDPSKTYEIEEAIKILKEMATVKFDETVEIAVRLGIDPKQSDQQVRGPVSLPHGTGKEVRVLVFAQGDKAKEAQDAGADYVGTDELAEKIQNGWFGFDAAVATPDLMRIVGKLGKLLGPRGLMPNAKVGTVTFDVGQTVKEIKAGRLEVRNDKFGNIHLPLGKTSFPDNHLVDNLFSVLETLMKMKPAAARGRYIKGITLTTTMGVGLKLDPNQTISRMDKRAA